MAHLSNPVRVETSEMGTDNASERSFRSSGEHAYMRTWMWDSVREIGRTIEKNSVVSLALCHEVLTE